MTLFSIICLVATSQKMTEERYPFDKMPLERLGQVRMDDVNRIVNSLQTLRDEAYNGFKYPVQSWNQSLSDSTWTVPRNFLDFRKGPISVAFLADNGHISALTVRPPYKLASNFNRDDCINRTRAYYKATGLPYPIKFFGDIKTNVENEFHFSFQFQDERSPYWTGGSIEVVVDRTLATPEYMWFTYPAENLVTPNSVIDAETAQANAIAAFNSYADWPKLQVEPTKPSFWVPRFKQLRNQMGQKQEDLVATNTACLIYVIWILDANSWSDEANQFMRQARVFVDAESGEAIAIDDASGSIGGVTGKNSKPFKFEPESYSFGGAIGSNQTVHAKPIRGTKVILKSGKKTIVGTFDPVTMTIAVKTNGKITCGKPSPALAAALANAKSNPAFKKTRFVPPVLSKPQLKSVP